MVLSKTTCPECCERIVVDIVNGYGYCMYCGARVDTAEATPLTSTFRNALKIELENNNDENPLYREVVATFKDIIGGDVDGGIAELERMTSEGASIDEVLNIVDSQIIEWIVNGIDEDIPYRGGVTKVIGWIDDHEEVVLKNYLWMVLLQFGIKSQSVLNKDTARLLLISLFHFSRDCLPQFRNVLELVDVCDKLDAILEVTDRLLENDGDESELAQESGRCSAFLHHFCFMVLISTGDMSQKDVVKINRTLASKDLAPALAHLDEAFAQCDQGADFFDPLMAYFNEMLILQPQGRPAKGRPARRGRN